MHNKKLADFFGSYPQHVIHSDRPHSCGKLLRPARATEAQSTEGTERSALLLSRHLSMEGMTASVAGCPYSLRLGSRAGYPSRVCSITGDAIDEIAAAIDQLEDDLRAHPRALKVPGATARTASIWLMLVALNPELARLMRHYMAPGRQAEQHAKPADSEFLV